MNKEQIAEELAKKLMSHWIKSDDTLDEFLDGKNYSYILEKSLTQFEESIWDRVENQFDVKNRKTIWHCSECKNIASAMDLCEHQEVISNKASFKEPTEEEVEAIISNI